MEVQEIGAVEGETLTIELSDGQAGDRLEVPLAELSRAHSEGLRGFFS
jgi:hypothetical protein